MVDSVVIQSELTPKEDPKHIEEMIAKVDAANAPPASETPEVTTEKPAKPEWVPEKFWDAEKGEVRTEALAQSYKELESQHGKKEEPKAAPEVDPSKATQEDAEAQLATKGLDLNTFSQEFAQKGELSAESYDALEKAGYDRAIVDQYIAGQKALATQYQADVKSAAGGDEGFTKMVEWATVNATADEIAAYNRAVDSGDVSTAKLAVAGLYQQYQESNPTEPRLVTGANGGVSSDVYESVQDYLKDSKNPEYKSNPSFRAKVIAKLGRSNIL